MATIEALRRQVARIRQQSLQVRPGREYVLAMVEGETVAEGLLRHIMPHDTLTLRMLPAGYLGNLPPHEQSMGYWKKGPRGKEQAKTVKESSKLDDRNR